MRAAANPSNESIVSLKYGAQSQPGPLEGCAVEVDGVTRGKWRDIIGTFDDASIYQSWSWGGVKMGERNLSHVVLRQYGAAVAAAQSWIVKLPLLGCGIAYVKWGPMWLPSGQKKNMERYRLMLRALKEEYAERRGLMLRVTPNVTDGDAAGIYEMMREEGFAPSLTTVPYRTIILDLFHPEEALRSTQKRQWRQCLNTAEKDGLRIRELTGDVSFNAVAGLYNEMRGRKKFAEFLGLRKVRAVQRDLPPYYKMKVTACESGDDVLAACITTKFGAGAIGMIAATSTEGLCRRASHLLQWRIMENLKSSGCMWYDLGGIDPVKYHGPYLFKAGLAGKLGRDVTFQEFDYCTNPASMRAVNMGDRLRAAYRDALEAAARMRGRSASGEDRKRGEEGDI